MIKRYLPKTFFYRSLIILVMPVILIHIISGYVFFHRHWDSIQELLAQNISGEISSLVHLAHNYGFSSSEKIARERYGIAMSLTPFFPAYSTNNSYLDESLSHDLAYPYRVVKTHRLLTIWVKTPLYIYRFYMPSKRLAPRTTLLFILWALGSSVVFLMIAIIVMRNQIRPLRRLVSWTKELEKENPNLLPKIEGAREIRVIANAIQMIVKRIHRSFEERNRMLQGISHDLRTPLARMKLQLQLLPPHDDLKALQQDVEQMIAMVNSYLTFAKQAQEPKSPVNIKTLLEELIDTSASLLVIKEFDSDLIFNAQPLQIRRCIQNLLDNAYRYAHSQIIIRGFKKHKNLVLVIEDDGPGIPENLRETIFTPFFRADEGRSLEGERVGLGLSIVKSIVISHLGSIHVGSSSLGGAAFQLTFPL